MPGDESRRSVAVVVAVLVLVAVAAIFAYTEYYEKSHPKCDAKIESCCLTERAARIYIKADRGECSDLSIRISPVNGEPIGETPVLPGENDFYVNLPGEAKYIVELLYKGKVIDKITVVPEPLPAVDTHTSMAMITPYGDLRLIVRATNTESCLAKNYSIASVEVHLVFKNGTSRDLKFDGPYPFNKVITLNLNLTTNEIIQLDTTQTVLYIKDSLGATYGIPLAMPS